MSKVSRLPERHRIALADIVAGGFLYIYVGAGPLCKRPPTVGSGVIIGGAHDRLSVSVGTVNALVRRFVAWSAPDKAYVLRHDAADLAGMLSRGRDVIEVSHEH